MLQAGDDPRFLFKTFLELWIEQEFSRHHLDRHIPLKAWIIGAEDFCHSTLANKSMNFVTTDLFWHVLALR